MGSVRVDLLLLGMTVAMPLLYIPTLCCFNRTSAYLLSNALDSDHGGHRAVSHHQKNAFFYLFILIQRAHTFGV